MKTAVCLVLDFRPRINEVFAHLGYCAGFIGS